MSFSRGDPVQVQRLADVISNDAAEYNVGLSFVTQQNNEIAKEINLERAGVTAGQNFISGTQLLKVLTGANVTNSSGDQAWLQFIGSVLIAHGNLEIGDLNVRASLKSAFNPGGQTAIDGLATKDPASISDAEWGVGTKLTNVDIAAARALP